MKLVEDSIREILTRLPSENSCLDYKQIPYKKEKYHDLIKDVISMLNSEDGYTQDKYLIFGVTDAHVKIGLRIPMPDDSEIQAIMDKIRPRPEIQSGKLIFESLEFGYIMINGSNNERVYEVKHTYPEQTHEIHEGQAFIRRCTSTRIMNQSDRRRIESIAIESTHFLAGQSFLYPVIGNPSQFSNMNPMLIASLIGSWNEKNPNDILFIESLIKSDYFVWTVNIQTLLTQGDKNLSLKNGVWSVKNRNEIIATNCKTLFDNHIDSIVSQIAKSLSVSDPLFDIPNEDRLIAQLGGSETSLSTELTREIAKTLAILSSKKHIFSNCTVGRVKEVIDTAVYSILNEKDWKIWETINWNLKYLVQASPDSFFRVLEKEISQSNNQIEKLFSEVNGSISQQFCGSGLIHALQVIAWSKDYFSRAYLNLHQIDLLMPHKTSDLPINIIPWNIQTEAPKETRYQLINSIYREFDKDIWSFIEPLLPNQTTTVITIEKPEFIQGNYDIQKITNEQYWDDVNFYLEIATKIAKGVPDYLLFLVKLIDEVPTDGREKILNLVVECNESLIDEKDRFIIWDELLKLVTKHQKFSDADWAFDEKILNEVLKVAELIAPKEEAMIISRYFKEEQYELIDDSKDYSIGERELFQKQVDIVVDLYERKGFEGIKNLVKFSSNKFLVGIAFGQTRSILDNITDYTTWYNSDSELSSFSQGLLYQLYRRFGQELINKIDYTILSCSKKVDFLKLLEFNEQTWKTVEVWLGESVNLYWESVSVLRKNFDKTEYAISQLLKVKKYDSIIQIIANDIIKGKPADLETTLIALELRTSETRESNTLVTYYIQKIFGWLQKNCPDKSRLSKLEWRYFNLLESDVRPVTLFTEISRDSELFVKFLSLAFRSETGQTDPDHNQEIDPQNLSVHAWTILNKWNQVPGYNENGEFSKAQFNEWFDKVIELSSLNGRLRIALTIIGKVLFHTPKDATGLFINRDIALIIDMKEYEYLRNGYMTEAINSRGVHWVDPSGQEDYKLEQSWKDKAKALETICCLRFSETAKMISSHFKDEGDRNRAEAVEETE